MSAQTVGRSMFSRAFYTREEAADEARVSVETIKRAINAGRLLAKRTGENGGGKYLISAEQLHAWFESLEDA